MLSVLASHDVQNGFIRVGLSTFQPLDYSSQQQASLFTDTMSSIWMHHHHHEISASNHTDLSVFCTDFKTKILKVYTKTLKTEHQNEHNWSIIGKLLLKILKRL